MPTAKFKIEESWKGLGEIAEFLGKCKIGNAICLPCFGDSVVYCWLHKRKEWMRQTDVEKGGRDGHPAYAKKLGNVHRGSEQVRASLDWSSDLMTKLENIVQDHLSGTVPDRKKPELVRSEPSTPTNDSTGTGRSF